MTTRRIIVDLAGWELDDWPDKWVDLITVEKSTSSQDGTITISLPSLAHPAIMKIISEAIKVFLCGDETSAYLTAQGVKIEAAELRDENGEPTSVTLPWNLKFDNLSQLWDVISPPWDMNEDFLPFLGSFIRKTSETDEIDLKIALSRTLDKMFANDGG